ncbi:PIN domain-containing protein [Halobaculum sp. WSA2]|uniref:PIN domain-containing protein n=1 Tax=Halobaculum saliterrae TaxID=2073113 RepID=A0A6B0SPE9_9EURY|nr:PIN domain-containing protein [Halobaculum saliterrae]MXR40798.1 PIN domain-containing protein [Halobaculum saliterrae]
MILDTQSLGALVDRDEDARAKAAELEEDGIPIRIPTAVVWEAYTGIGNAADTDTAEQLRMLYERLSTSRSTLELTSQVARRAGELNGHHITSDSAAQLDGADSVVAAHGLLLDEPVISNDSDFQGVDGLGVVTY